MSGDHTKTTYEQLVSKEHQQKAHDALEGFVLSKEKGGKVQKLFGLIPVPEEMRSIVSLITMPLVDFVTDKAAKTADHMLPGAGKVVSYSLPILAYFQPVVGDSISYKKEMSGFNAKLHPLFAANKADKSGMGKLFDSGERPNAIIQFARNQKHGKHLNTLFGDVVDGGVKYTYHYIKTNKDYKNKIKGLTHGDGDLEKHFGGINPEHLASSLIGGLSDGLKRMVNSKLPEQFKGKCSLDMCYEFADDISAASKSIDPLDKREFDRELRAQSQKIISIFKARYKESGWNQMPDRVSEKLDDVAAQLARPMLTGELSPLAIINLAGENHILQNNGHSVANDSDVQTAIDDQMRKLSTARIMSLEEFTIDTELKVSDIAGALKTLGAEEKAYLSIVVPDSVLIKGGATKEQIEEFRKEGEKSFDSISEVVIHDLAKRPADEMREFFSKKDIAFLRELDKALTEIGNKPRNREDDLDVLDEKDQLLQNSVVKKILAKGYLKADTPGSWTQKVADERNGAEHHHKKHLENGEKTHKERAEHSERSHEGGRDF